MAPEMSSLASHLKAGGVHLALSGFVACVSLALIFLCWYPGALAEMQGVSRLVLILIGVDVVLGPLLTTIIYKPGKRGLKFDLTVIASVQAGALLYGMSAIYDGRPAYIVFNVDRFDVVAVEELNATSLERVSDNLRVSWFGPRWVGAELPKSAKEREKILFSAISGGADVPQLPELYVALDTLTEAMSAKLHDLGELPKLNDIEQSDWEERIHEAFGLPEDELGYLPVRANAFDGAVIVERATGKQLSLWALTPSFKKIGAPPK